MTSLVRIPFTCDDGQFEAHIHTSKPTLLQGSANKHQIFEGNNVTSIEKAIAENMDGLSKVEYRKNDELCDAPGSVPALRLFGKGELKTITHYPGGVFGDAENGEEAAIAFQSGKRLSAIRVRDGLVNSSLNGDFAEKYYTDGVLDTGKHKLNGVLQDAPNGEAAHQRFDETGNITEEVHYNRGVAVNGDEGLVAKWYENGEMAKAYSKGWDNSLHEISVNAIQKINKKQLRV